MMPPRVTPLDDAGDTRWTLARIGAAIEQLQCPDCSSSVGVIADTTVRGFVVHHSPGCPWLNSGCRRGDVVV